MDTGCLNKDYCPRILKVRFFYVINYIVDRMTRYYDRTVNMNPNALTADVTKPQRFL